jgi:2-polyprenyl-3-methyl-5-hydroxy-6-metoxy-1,4-benzoquinol methylase/D-ribose pyranose/furanose isomerase RbsD
MEASFAGENSNKKGVQMNNNERSDFYRKLSENFELCIEHIETLSGSSGAHAHLVQAEGKKWAFCKIFEVEDEHKREIRRSKKAAIRMGTSPNILEEGRIDLKGKQKPYFYILMERIGGTTHDSFKDYYKKNSSDQIKNLITKLFNQRFVEDELDDTTCIFRHITFNQSFHKNLKCPDFDQDDYQRFISWWEAKKDCVNFPITTNTVHGDLHSNNIRVDYTGKPHLIDFGCTEKREALKDFTRLERDLRLTVLYEVTPNATFNKMNFIEMQEVINKGLEQKKTAGSQNIDQQLEKSIDVISHIRKLSKSKKQYKGKLWKLEYNYLLLLEFMFYAASTLDRPTIVRKSAFRLGIGQMEKVDELLMQQYLWKITYSLLRLDQLPIGGWGRSIPGWWRATHNNDQDSLYYSYKLRKRGGMNVTCNAFIQYFYFLSRVIDFDLDRQYELKKRNQKLMSFHLFEGENKIARRVIDDYIKPRVGQGGGMDIFPRSVEENRPVTNLFHSVLAMICYMLSFVFYSDELYSDFMSSLKKLFKSTAGFLIENLHHWDQDEKNQYAMLAGISYLLYLLDKKQLLDDLLGDEDVVKKLENCLKTTQYKILNSENLKFKMDSDFLLQAHYFFNQSGTKFNLDLNEKLKSNNSKVSFARQFFSNIYNMSISCVNNQYCLIPSGVSHFDFSICEDIGSLAQLCALLNKSYTQECISIYNSDISEKTKNLKRRLMTMATEYSENQSFFRLTNGITYSYILNTLDMDISEDEFHKMESILIRLQFITEYEICDLLSEIFTNSYHSLSGGTDNISLSKDANKRLEIINTYFINPISFVPKKILDLKNLILSKIEPGIHNQKKPDRHFIKKWLNTTKTFFSSELGVKNATANELLEKRFNGIHLTGYLKNLKEIKEDDQPLRILDIGCGKAYYAANLFLPNGFSVDFLDNSENILKIAKQEMEKYHFDSNMWKCYQFDINNFNGNVWQYNNFLRKGKYDFIFCDAVLFHCTKDKLPDVLSALRHILLDNGILFANFKINDHTIVSNDGRFFEFYENHLEIDQIFIDSRFRIRETTLTRKEKTMYNEYNRTYWAHYYCTKNIEKK